MIFLEKRMPKSFTIANFGHSVSKSWHRHCSIVLTFERVLVYDEQGVDLDLVSVHVIGQRTRTGQQLGTGAVGRA